MHSPEELQGEDNEDSILKKRKVQRACDICRRKKIRCDGGQMPGNRCSSCVTYNLECKYEEAAKKRGPPKGYVENLENRLQKMEALLHKLLPDGSSPPADLNGVLDKSQWSPDHQEQPAPSGSLSSATTSPIPPGVVQPKSDDLDLSDDENIVQNQLIGNMKEMQLNDYQINRFFGKSSSAMFVERAIQAKRDFAHAESGGTASLTPQNQMKRPEFWRIHPWIFDELHLRQPTLTFPDPDLMNTLINLFFDKINVYQPLLHRPTLDAAIRDGLHYRDESFGSVVLLVCATASQFCDDPRVLLKGSNDTHSSGWEWFSQVQRVRRSIFSPPKLFDLQICTLTAIYLQSTSVPHVCWSVVGAGIRLAQDVGAHRRKRYTECSYRDQELWKRAFWILISMDRSLSMKLGRACAIQDEDFDLDLPVECDDEYWVISAHPNGQREFELVDFKHPPGKPSKISYFNYFLRLDQILAFALRTVYSINKSKTLLGFVGTQWEQRIVAELDSALNKWIDSVPDFLRWDPHRQDMVFLNQSAALYAHYYQLQIAVHRPFIPTPNKPSPLFFPSLAICTNAARSCTHVLDTPFRRGEKQFHSNMDYELALFTSGLVLLLNIWGGKRSGLSTDPLKEMADVHKCMKMLKAIEAKSHTAGRLRDILCELAHMGDLPLPQPSPPPRKRDRDTDTFSAAGSPQPSTCSSASSPLNEPAVPSERMIAGSKRVTQHHQSRQSLGGAYQAQGDSPVSPGGVLPASHASSPSMTHPSPGSPDASFGYGTPVSPATYGANGTSNHNLPMYTSDLGRMPLHPGSGITTYSSSLNGAVPMVDVGATSSYGTNGNTMSQMYAPTGSSTPMTQDHTPNGSSYDNVMSMFVGQTPFASNFDGYHLLEANNTEYTTAAASPGIPSPGIPMGASNFTENDLYAMWSNGPQQGFEWDDWGNYISNGTGAQPQPHPQAHPQNMNETNPPVTT
ncbi:fungal-specific transcription factor domain-containing protein [Cristinia sonorae]|uniref:Fungal-specific transcription factor domain-containing protein n=1 Tax=Cristinia sonorae TaxID=1940300 RepID=A0A8K0XT19_9AGAR|nr:fungal-specific transcription factor domain-containing protein [Cristinia sonorae]